jgi:rubrerythrin
MSVGYLAKCASHGKPKKRFTSRAEAEGLRSALVRAGTWTKNKSNTYQCNACGFWHAGSTGSGNRGQAKGHRKARRSR